jgi:hypothetical protein
MRIPVKEAMDKLEEIDKKCVDREYKSYMNVVIVVI